MIELTFSAGTLEIRGANGPMPGVPSAVWDTRSALLRAEAAAYADVVRALVRGQIPYEDRARAYSELAHGLVVQREPRPFQAEAMAAWERARGRGVVVLPTGAGKTQVGLMAINSKRRSTLVVAPTLDLVRQWYDLLRTSFGTEVGVIGGGEYRLAPLTVTTYDSAYLHMENLGARFGLVIFDECHHLPSESYAFAARQSIAPYRLGLTATPERTDGRDAQLHALVGPEVYRREIVHMSGEYLAEYETERIAVELADDERAEYEEERAIYLAFARSRGVQFGSPDGFRDF